MLDRVRRALAGGASGSGPFSRTVPPVTAARWNCMKPTTAIEPPHASMTASKQAYTWGLACLCLKV